MARWLVILMMVVTAVWPGVAVCALTRSVPSATVATMGGASCPMMCCGTACCCELDSKPTPVHPDSPMLPGVMSLDLLGGWLPSVALAYVLPELPAAEASHVTAEVPASLRGPPSVQSVICCWLV